MSLESRLQALPQALLEPRLLAVRGLGNELGFYVFDYPPEREPDVQRALPKIAQAVRDAGVEVVMIDLYRTVLELLEGRQFLERAFQFEREKGSEALRGALKSILSAEKVAQSVAAQAGTAQLVLLSNVGAAYPLVRSHGVLNNLHERLDTVPMVMLFPGRYDGQELRLFGLFKDDNYYRAFRLLPES